MPQTLDDWFGLALFFIVISLFVHQVLEWARKTPPAKAPEGELSGVGGALSFVFAVFVFGGVFNLATFSNLLNQWSILDAAGQGTGGLVRLLVPTLFAVAAYTYGTIRLSKARTRRVVSDAIIVLWLAGPLFEAGSLFVFQATPKLDFLSLLIVAIHVAIALAATLYLLKSKRVQNTYGQTL